MRLPNKVSDDFKKVNPDFFAPGGVARLPDPERKQIPVQPLAPALRRRPKGKSRLVVSVEIISFRHRLLDEDNLTAGGKKLRDLIACSLGVDDADPRLRFKFHQLETSGPEGTIVKITPL